MKQKEVFHKIGGIIEELSEQYEYLKTVSDDLNDLELELFVANAHFLTDHIEVLCKLNLQNRPKRRLPDQDEVTTYEKKFFEPVVHHAVPPKEEKKELPLFKPEPVRPAPVEKQEAETAKVLAEKQEVKPANVPAEKKEEPEKPDLFIFEPEATETIRHELVIDESMLTEDEDFSTAEDITPYITPEPETAQELPVILPEVKTEEEKKVIIPEPEPVTATVTIEKEILTINEKISGQLGEKNANRTEQVSIKPISDLKLAITLNDKLLYVKDLFNGYNLAYSEAIEILNRFSSFEEASRFLKTNYVTKNNWDGKPATVEKFYALLKRRYA